MNYMEIRPFDTANGEGVRVSLFVAGCKHHCEGCFNRESWKFNAGKEFTYANLYGIIQLMSDNAISGLSILGGEPLDDRNIQEVTNICKRIKTVYPEKSIWLWTGFQLHEKIHLDVMKYVDVVIDGKYDSSKPTVKPYRGSDNQNLWRKEYGWQGDCQWRAE